MTDNSTSSHLPRRGEQRADRSADGRRAAVTPVNGHATSKRAHTVVDVANHDMEGVAKGSGLASAVAPASARGTLGDGVAACRTRRVVSFGLIGRFLCVIGSQGGPDCACASELLSHDLAVSQASPCKVSGARYRGSDIGFSLPTQLLE